MPILDYGWKAAAFALKKKFWGWILLGSGDCRGAAGQSPVLWSIGRDLA
jgi:hypothetical protein